MFDAYFYAGQPVEYTDLDEVLIRALVTASCDQDAEQGDAARSIARARYSLTPGTAPWADKDELPAKMLAGEEAEMLFRRVSKAAFAKSAKVPLSQVGDDYVQLPDDAFFFDGAYTNAIWPTDLVTTAASATGDYEGVQARARYDYCMKQRAIRAKADKEEQETTK